MIIIYNPYIFHRFRSKNALNYLITYMITYIILIIICNFVILKLRIDLSTDKICAQCVCNAYIYIRKKNYQFTILNAIHRNKLLSCVSLINTSNKNYLKEINDEFYRVSDNGYFVSCVWDRQKITNVNLRDSFLEYISTTFNILYSWITYSRSRYFLLQTQQ